MVFLKNFTGIVALATLSTAGTIAVSSPAHAYRIFFGEDLNHSGSTPLSSFTNAQTAESNFLSGLVGVGTETFEGFAPGSSAPLNLSFPGAGTATLQGNGTIRSVTPGTTNGVGRYAISGSNFWEVDAGGNFLVNFSQQVAAFGFYGVDIGDFGGQLTLNLAAGGTKQVTVPNTIGSYASTDGSVLYYGLIAETFEEAFTSISFNMSTGEGDYFAFDNMTIGSLEQVKPVPEPASTLGLLALGAMGAGSMLKRKQQQKATVKASA